MDGTRNKVVTITAVSSNARYTCVASDIPGIMGDHREEADIFILPPEEENSTEDFGISTSATGRNTNNSDRMISK